jgi:hypothetical protein
MSREDADIRGRIERGDEDSVVNFWLYGTTFTTRPRATREVMASVDAGGVSEIVAGRLEDLLDALAGPDRGNERLRLARDVLARHGISVAAPGGRERAWDFLDQVRGRMAAEEEAYARTITSAGNASNDERLSVYARLFAERGLSSDTGMPIGFAVHRSLADLAAADRMPPGGVDRVGIVGPGLDFTDKAEGYDFYPQQSIQPFAVANSLVGLGLSRLDELAITTLDVSKRVTSHLEAAQARAARGVDYRLHLPLDRDTPLRQWQPGLVEYWEGFGAYIGDPVAEIAPPPGLESVRIRAVDVRPEVVQRLRPRDVNVILERLDPLPPADQFDLVIATNVLLYYDAFEQALALANIARMLRPGGFLLTSDAVYPVAPLDTSPAQVTVVERDRQGTRDTLFAYQRH